MPHSSVSFQFQAGQLIFGLMIIATFFIIIDDKSNIILYSFCMSFSITRFHRYRAHAGLRTLFQDVFLKPSDFIAPIFIHEVQGKEAIAALPGHYRLDIGEALAYIEFLLSLGITGFILFPVVPNEKKTLCCSYAFDDKGIIPSALQVFKKNFPQAVFIADVALDPFHLKGHDGILSAEGALDNDASCHILAQQALCYALAGADIVAPSDMMDGRVSAIRRALDQRGLKETLILSYTAKYASCLYGPFRQAVDSEKYLGTSDKKTYQMDPASSFQALLEAQDDRIEGADLLMVKPGLPYLDVLAQLAQQSPLPVWSYHVSAECAMIDLGVKAGLFTLEDILYEQFIAQRRAGAQKIITYYAAEAAKIFAH